MTKKDYIIIANIISEWNYRAEPDTEQLNILIQLTIDWLQRESPRFDEERFKELALQDTRDDKEIDEIY